MKHRIATAVFLALSLIVTSAYAQGQERPAQAQQGQQQDTGGQQTGMQNVTLIGEAVVNAENEEIGQVEKLVIDTNDGSVKGVVITTGGVMGIGAQYHLIPWEMLSVEKNRIVAQVDVEKIKQSPTTDDLDVLDTTWLEQSFRHYNVPLEAGKQLEFNK